MLLPEPRETQQLYWIHDGPLIIDGDMSDFSDIRQLVEMVRLNENITSVMFVHFVGATDDSFILTQGTVANDVLSRPVLLSFELNVTKSDTFGLYELTASIHVNGQRISSRQQVDELNRLGGVGLLGRQGPTVTDQPDTPRSRPLMGRMRSFTIDTARMPDDFASTDVWQQCTAAGPPTKTTTTAAAAAVDASTTSSTSSTGASTTSIAITGGNVNGGDAAFSNDNDDDDNAGPGGLPLMLFIALAVVVVCCAAVIAATCLVRSRGRQANNAMLKTGMAVSPPADGAGGLSKSSSRSGSRRRKSVSNKSKGTYAAIDVSPVSDDYTTMPMSSSSSASGYRSMPGGDEGYRAIPVDVEDGYSTMPTSSVGSTEYMELQRTKVSSPSDPTYAQGELAPTT